MYKRVVRISVAIVAVLVVVGFGMVQLGLVAGLQQTEGPAANLQARPVILEEVRRVNKQIFVEHYSSVDIDYTEAPAGFLNALQKIGIRQHYVVLVRGTVPAGFDLKQLSEDAIWVSPDGKRAQVTLPPPMIFEENVSIDYEHSRILAEADACPDFLCTADLRTYNDMILPEGRKRLIAAARQNEILRQAAAEGKIYYENLLNKLGIAEVRVVVEGYNP